MKLFQVEIRQFFLGKAISHQQGRNLENNIPTTIFFFLNMN